ncbi:MAG: GatB/YqeY domain-containing protein [Pseudomonadota bacterium]
MRQRITAALKDAMRGDDPTRTATLRLVLAAIKDREIENRTSSEEGSEISEGDVLQLLAKMIKQREESVKTYEEAGRVELAQREVAEIAVISEFLPKPLDASEAEVAMSEAIAEIGASSLKDMGSVMALLKQRYAGRMDFAAIGPMVKQRLGA